MRCLVADLLYLYDYRLLFYLSYTYIKITLKLPSFKSFIKLIVLPFYGTKNLFCADVPLIAEKTNRIVDADGMQSIAFDLCKCTLHPEWRSGLLHCPTWNAIRAKHFTATILLDLFSKVTSRCIIDFIKEIGFFRRI